MQAGRLLRGRRRAPRFMPCERRASPHAQRMRADTHRSGAVLEADGVGVSDVRGAGVGELQAGGPAVVDDVVDLAGDLLVVERGQVREGLEEPAGGGRVARA